MKDWTLTPEAFEKLLNWLNEDDRDQAGRDLLDIHRRLVKFFTCRGCCEPEDVADDTVTRVAGKVDELQDFIGPRATYFYSVGNNVLHEWNRKIFKRRSASPPAPI